MKPTSTSIKVKLVPAAPMGIGFTMMSHGWVLTVEGERVIRVDDTSREFTDYAIICEEGIITYSKPERVPKDVRVAVKVLSRRLARALQDRQV
jgi:hypothetical protein